MRNETRRDEKLAAARRWRALLKKLRANKAIPMRKKEAAAGAGGAHKKNG